MFVLLISCFSTWVFLRSVSLKPIATVHLKLSSFTFQWLQRGRAPKLVKKPSPDPREKDQTWEEMNNLLLDLPELAFDDILEKLSPVELCSLAAACSYLRERCTSDHLWERHLKQKWGIVMSPVFFEEWRSYVDSSSCRSIEDSDKGLFGSLNGVWPLSWFRPKTNATSKPRRTRLPADSLMALYLSLESGKFWFPAQVYNRQNGHMGFMLSCYDAKLSYDFQSDTFLARYSPNGRRTIEESVQWDRLRVAPIDTAANTIHVSDCLAELKPGDHVEVQWRKTKEFPYGWWYAVIGHLESCNGNKDLCRCHDSGQVAVEFNQYTPGSRWRRIVIDRKEHREEGNEADGFYGGVRKLYKEEEISKWRRFWPDQVYD